MGKVVPIKKLLTNVDNSNPEKIETIHDVNFYPLKDLNLNSKAIERLRLKFKDKPKVLQESINNFVADMNHGKSYDDPAAVFMGVMMRGDGRYNLRWELCETQEQAEKEMRHSRKALKKKIAAKHFDNELAKWYIKHEREEIKELAKQIGVSGTMASFGRYFFKEVWPDIVTDYVNNILYPKRKSLNDVSNFIDYSTDAYEEQL